MNPREFDFKDFMNFKQLIIPSIMKIIYLVVGVLIILSGLVVMFTSGGVLGFFMGLLGIVFSEMLWRICCESMLVMFLIYDELKTVNQNVRSQTKSDFGGEQS
jgi:ABC-type multidrug transport system fused ATPase/permease subunit